jgi:hypothetical protein
MPDGYNGPLLVSAEAIREAYVAALALPSPDEGLREAGEILMAIMANYSGVIANNGKTYDAYEVVEKFCTALTSQEQRNE